jgi:hypothetical protein
MGIVVISGQMMYGVLPQLKKRGYNFSQTCIQVDHLKKIVCIYTTKSTYTISILHSVCIQNTKPELNPIQRCKYRFLFI